MALSIVSVIVARFVPEASCLGEAIQDGAASRAGGAALVRWNAGLPCAAVGIFV
jgi:hypothetical protein